MASLALFRLLGHLAAGGLAALAIIQPGQVSRAFFQFSAALYAALIAIALVVRPDVLDTARLVVCEGAHGPALAAGAGIALLGLAALLAGTQALFVGRLGTAAGRALLRVAAALAIAAVLADGFGGQAAGAATGASGAAAALPLPRALGPLGALFSALLLGSALTAMTLGHWYLVLPRLSPAPLYRLTWLYAIAVGLRAVAVLGAIAVLYLAEGRAFDRFAASAGFLVWPRLLLGVFAPALLAVTALPAVRVRDTQPATGMLYVACVLVLVGEGLGLYLAARTGVPL